MITAYEAPVGEFIDFGWVVADHAAAERYWRSVGVQTPFIGEHLPLGLAFVLRGGPSPAVTLAPDTVSVHGGHSITAEGDFLPGRYRVRAGIAEVFEKSGRSGPLLVIVRAAELLDESGAIAVAIREQQIVRRPSPRPPTSIPPPPRIVGHSVVDDDLDVGATVISVCRPAPGAALVRAYASSLGTPEPLFADRAAARALGFADLIVPGPMQATLFEALLRQRLPDWRSTTISLSFRVSLTVDEPISLRAVVTELSQGHDRLGVDLTLENSNMETAAAGTATLIRHSPR